MAGILSALLGWGVLVNATAVTWDDGGPVVEMSVFGGRLGTWSAFTGGHGIVTVRPNVTSAEPAATPGRVVSVTGDGRAGPARRSQVVERVAEAAGAAPIEEARVIVAGGRGVGGPDGFRVVESLAEALGGAVGATRAAVDSGWIPYGQQIGQTGKIVKPALYVALGISGAIQHKVGMQTADTIVAVNRDPDAPIAEFADLFVVGDLFEVVPAIVAALTARERPRRVRPTMASILGFVDPARRLRRPRRDLPRPVPTGVAGADPDPRRGALPARRRGPRQADRRVARPVSSSGSTRSAATRSIRRSSSRTSPPPARR